MGYSGLSTILTSDKAKVEIQHFCKTFVEIGMFCWLQKMEKLNRLNHYIFLFDVINI